MYQIAFVTYKDHSDLSKDDKLIEEYLTERNINFQAIPWDEKNIDWEKFDAVVIRSCWDYYLHEEKFRGWLKKLKFLNVKLFNDPEKILWNIDKTYLRDIQNKGFKIPVTIWVDKNNLLSLSELLKEKGWSKAVIKPSVSAGAYETWTTDPNNAVEDQERFNILVKERSVLIQEYLEQINSYGEISLIFLGQEYSHSVLKRPVPDDFRVQLEFGGTVKSINPRLSFIETAARLVRDYSDDKLLYARVDGVKVGDDFLIMELELIEPALFLSFHPAAPERFAHALRNSLGENNLKED
jgi:glutathione synthase/RimK-type ligase-like ATP-grasp enzyme